MRKVFYHQNKKNRKANIIENFVICDENTLVFYRFFHQEKDGIRYQKNTLEKIGKSDSENQIIKISSHFLGENHEKVQEKSSF